MNNLKQLGIAWTIYNGDNGGKISSCVPFISRGIGNSNAWVLGVSCPTNWPNPFGVVDAGVLDATNQNAISRGTLFPCSIRAARFSRAARRRRFIAVPRIRARKTACLLCGVIR
jgi:hypothetical protein